MIIGGIKIDERDEVPKVAMLLTKPQLVKLLQSDGVRVPANLTKNELLVYAAIKGVVNDYRMDKYLKESGKYEKAKAMGPSQTVNAMKLLEKSPRKAAARTYKKKSTASTSTAAKGARKYQDANGRWRWASGAKKGKFAPAPRK